MFNRQRKFGVSRTILLDFARQVSQRLEIRSGFSVVLISDKAMRRFNREFAGHDEATDVLSFSTGARFAPSPDAASGELSVSSGSNLDMEPGQDCYLGDILISVETAERQRKAGLEDELKVLTLHGLLHLLGYDHAVDQGEMEQLENQLKGEFSLS